MTDFTIHSIDSAPEKAKPLLEKGQKTLGFIPNLYGVMAESPQTLEAYQTLGNLLGASSLSAVELNVIWLAINVENECHYCVPAHTVIARGQGVDEDTIAALREARALPDERLEALRQFTLKVVRQRGRLSEAEVQTFLDAGFTRQNILEVILVDAQKTISNYVNHLADTPVDDAFKGEIWQPGPAQAAE